VEFDMTQHYDAPAPAVMEVFTDPTFYEAMGAVAPLSAPELIPDDDPDRVQLRYTYLGDLPPGAGRFISSDKLTWVQDSRIDREGRVERIRVLPDHYPDRLDARITIEYLDAAGGTDRRIHGELKVNVPLVSGRVERAIVDGLRETLDAQEAAAAERLS
jgi:hypothetical protein